MKVESGDPPDFIVDWPDVDPQWVHVWEAWHRLAGDRATGFGPGGTPFMAVDRYAERYDMGDFHTFHDLIRAMDTTYLTHMQQKRERDG